MVVVNPPRPASTLHSSGMDDSENLSKPAASEIMCTRSTWSTICEFLHILFDVRDIYIYSAVCESIYGAFRVYGEEAEKSESKNAAPRDESSCIRRSVHENRECSRVSS